MADTTPPTNVIPMINPEEVVEEVAPRPEEFLGEAVDWLAPLEGEEMDTMREQNAITSIWIGVNSLNMDGYDSVPNLLRLIADEVEWQQTHGTPKATP